MKRPIMMVATLVAFAINNHPNMYGIEADFNVFIRPMKSTKNPVNTAAPGTTKTVALAVTKIFFKIL